MIFLCFSVRDRIPLINNFNQYLANFGVETWYDRRNIYLGDDRKKCNISDGAASASVDYAIIFYSENFKNGSICLEEYDILKKRYLNNEIHLFPVFIGSAPPVLESRFALCKQLVYKEIYSEDDFLRLTLHIVAKIIADKLENSSIKTIHEYIMACESDNLINDLLNEYENVNKENIHMRIGMLYSIFKMLIYEQQCDYFFRKTMNFIFYNSCYQDTIIEEKRELQIMENIIVIETLRLFPISTN